MTLCPRARTTAAVAMTPPDEAEEDTDLDETEEPTPDQESQRVPLDTGEPLTPSEVANFLLAREARFITIIGDRDSGKTTLICTIYEKFLRGSYAKHCFCESRTLIGLEKRCHPSRIASERRRPETPHTSIAEGLRYFHFAVSPLDHPRQRIDVMLSDRAGEVYKRARDQSESVKDLVEIPQADRLVLLLDGKRVADPVTRSGAMQSVRQSLRAFTDAGALGRSSVVQVLTTKIDLLLGADQKDKIESTLASFRERLAADYGPLLMKLSFLDVAARDPEGVCESALGVDGLFLDWISVPRRAATVEPPYPPMSSEFDRLLARTPIGPLP
jgi:hypothetical protein